MLGQDVGALAELSARATPGRLIAESRGKLIAKCRGAGDIILATVTGRQVATERAADAEFLAALWNAYRAGDLVAPSASGLGRDEGDGRGRQAGETGTGSIRQDDSATASAAAGTPDTINREEVMPHGGDPGADGRGSPKTDQPSLTGNDVAARPEEVRASGGQSPVPQAEGLREALARAIEPKLQEWIDWCGTNDETPEAFSGARIAVDAILADLATRTAQERARAEEAERGWRDAVANGEVYRDQAIAAEVLVATLRSDLAAAVAAARRSGLEDAAIIADYFVSARGPNRFWTMAERQLIRWTRAAIAGLIRDAALTPSDTKTTGGATHD